MSALHKFSLSTRLGLLLVLPSLVIVGLVIQLGFSEYAVYREATITVAKMEQAHLASAFVHELQKERGMSAGFLGSGGTRFVKELEEQRTETDKKLTDLKTFVTKSAPQEGDASLNEALNQAQGLGDLRSKVSAQSMPLPQVLAFYTGTIGQLVGHFYEIEKTIENPQIKEQIQTFMALVKLKESSGLERAVVANILAKGERTNELYKKEVILQSQQDIFRSDFNRLNTSQTLKQNITAWEDSDEVKQVNHIRQVIDANQADAFAALSEAWWKNATARINSIKSFEDEIANGMIADSMSLAQAARNALVLLMLGMLVVSGVIVGLVLTVAKSILNPIAQFTRVFNASANQLENLSTTMGAASQDVMVACISNVDKGKLVAENSGHISMNIKTIAAASEELQGTVAGTRQQVDRSNQIALEAFQKAEMAIKNVHNLVETSNSVGNIISLINDIADRTNLLALNAAIEAARAGDAGKGFAVVAEEVKKLSQSTMGATDEISEKIKNIQGVSQSVAQGIHAMRAVMEEMQDVSRAVQNSIHEQVVAVGSINENMNEANNRLASNDSNVEDMMGSLNQTQDVAEQVGTQAGVLKANTDSLTKEVRMFLIRVGASS